MSVTQIDPSALMAVPKHELIRLAQDIAQLEIQAARIGPQTPDELHQFIKDKYGIHVPRIAVTEGHDAPFDFISDGFFQIYTQQFVIANREGSKTFSVALLQALFARFFPGYEGLTAGAIEIQSRRAYYGLTQLNGTWGGDQIRESKISETLWKTGSRVEIVTGTYAALNGPHSWFLHRDEVELFRRDAFDEGNNITKSGVTRDGRQFKAHDVLTSTRKKAKGLVQELLDRVENAIRAGQKPPYRVYKWGVAETVRRVPNCRFHVPPGTPEDEICACHNYVNGFMPNGEDRTLAHICGGRFGRSDGWRPLEPDIATKFMNNSPAMWEAQHECSKPASEGLILANFDKSTHGIRNWNPNPENGPIFQSTDFGGTNPHAANWYQLTTRMVLATNYDGKPIFIPTGSLIVFDEVYVTEISNSELASHIVAHETNWKLIYTYWDVIERYADIAAKAARLEFRNYVPSLKTIWRITREVEEHIKLCVELVDKYRLYVDVDRCPMFIQEAEAWQRDPDTGRQIDEFNHCMSNFRYAIANIHRKLQIEARHKRDNGSAAASERQPISSAQDFTKSPTAGPSSRNPLRDDPYDIPIHQGPMTGLPSGMFH